MLKNFIDYLKIHNFKSVKKLDIPCNRINIFIGKPNVGKSNILEALSLFCLPNGIITTNNPPRDDYKINE
ncbi:MAG: AAA family ATPase, partial [Bacteroidota bacterium]